MKKIDNINSAKAKLEKLFLYSKDVDAQKSICKYLHIMKQQAYIKILQESISVEERSVLTGELRVIQKLIDILDVRSDLLQELSD